MWLTVFFCLFVSMTALLHVVSFFTLNLNIIDSDQPYMWIGARDFAHGEFYEPRYYAQDYNTFMEALFAVPFIWFGLPVYYAVPVATHIIFLFPFVFSSCYLFFHQKKIQAIIVLAVILCLPADYDLLTSLPRGFVTGLFFTSFFVLSILDPYNLRFTALNTILSLTGYFVSPNSVLVSVPFLFYLFLCNYTNLRYYGICLFCSCFYFPLNLFFNGFYKTHREYVMNDIHYSLSTEFFRENISDLDKLFAQLSFFVPGVSAILLLVLTVLSAALFRHTKKAFAAFWMFILTVLFSFCSGKVTEGSAWAFMSNSRMFLGIPIFLCLFLPLLPFTPKKIYYFLFCIPLIFSSYKLLNQKKLLAWHYDSSHFHGVRLFTLKDTLEAIEFYKQECKKRNADLILVSNRFWMNNLICYGGPATDEDYPETQETKLEKRYWVRNKNNAKVFKSFIMISSHPDMKSLLPKTDFFRMEKVDDYGLNYIYQNNLKTVDFIRLVNMNEPYD